MEIKIIHPNAITAVATANSGITNNTEVYDESDAPTPIFTVNPTPETERDPTTEVKLEYEHEDNNDGNEDTNDDNENYYDDDNDEVEEVKPPEEDTTYPILIERNDDDSNDGEVIDEEEEDRLVKQYERYPTRNRKKVTRIIPILEVKTHDN